MIKAIVFDLDGTLIDRKKAFLSYCDFLIEKYAKVSPFEGTRENLIKAMVEIDANGYGGLKNFLPKLERLWRLPISTEEFIQERNQLFGKLTVLMPGAKEVLEKLRARYKLGMITNGYSFTQRDKLATAGIETYFEDIIVSGEVPFAKPDPRIFWLSGDHLKVETEEMIYVGDYYPNDIAGAIRANIKPIWITEEPDEQSEFYNSYKEYEGIRIRELTELLKLL